MAMISSLCEKAIHLENGALLAFGTTNNVILGYASTGENSPARVNYRNQSRQIGDQDAQLLTADVRNESGTAVTEVEITRPFSVRMEYRITSDADRIYFPNFHFYREDGSCAFVVNAINDKRLSSGEYSAECHIPANFLNDGVYSIELALTSYEPRISVHFHERGVIMFNVRDPIDGVATRAGYSGLMPGAVRPMLPWTLKPIN
jgi:lipopolysaccharide transport system ATP-binding protein